MSYRFCALLAAITLAAPVRAADPAVDLGSVTEKHVLVPMRDGKKLSAYLYFPEGKGPWPVLYEQRYADLRGAETRKSFARLAAAGYVVAAQNFRGTHESEGTWVGYRALGWGEQKDGYDTVEWLAKQEWCSGKVGTFGSSQAGFAQNFLAVTRPPHLAAQYMIDTGLSLYQEGYRIGGTTRPERFKQMEAVCRDPEDNRKLLKEWFAHPTYDDYWAAEDCTRFLDKMDVPCFTVGSWYDFMCVGSVESYVGRQHTGGPNSRGAQQLLIGPWLHGRVKDVNKTGEMTYPEDAKFALEKHLIRWFDHYLKNVDNGVEREATVRYYTMGAVGEKGAPGNEWRTAKDWPVAAQDTPYFLHDGGKLALKAPDGDTKTTFKADPLHPNEIPNKSGFPGAADARAFEKQAEVRTFTSEVLEKPVEWTGKVRAELYVSSSARDTDFIVRVCDVYPDGRSILLMDYVRRARYRDGYDKEVMLEPGKVYKLAFDVGWTSQVFNAGHRIRVTVASTGAPFYEVNPNTGEPLTIEPPTKTEVATNAVHHGKQYASRVIAPVRAVGISKEERGKLERGLKELQERLAKVKAKPEAMADAELFAKGAAWALRYDETLTDADAAQIRKALERGTERAAALEAGKQPWAQRQGKVARAYVSDVDGSVQPFGVIVPAKYDPAKPIRLDVVLHGSTKPVGMSELRFVGRFDEGDGEAKAPEQDFIELHPLGRVENCYRWAGETDVFEAIEAVCRMYNIDRDRIVLRGMSMGASGTWHLGLKHPDKFVALGPYCGYVDTHQFSQTPLSNFVKVGELPPHQERGLHMLDSIDYAANAGVVPAVACMGEKDVFFQAHVLMADAMAKEGLPKMVNLISPGTGHVIDPDTHKEQMRLIGEYAGKGINHTPVRLRFVTWTLKYNRCHWLEILGLEEHYARAEVRAQAADDGSIYLTEPKNVTSFALRPPVKVREGSVLRIAGKEVGKLPPKAERVYVRKGDDGWVLSTEPVKTTGKRPGLQGPIDDAFTSRFLCVRGTGKAWNPAVQAWADASLKQFAAEWQQYFRGELPVKDDVDVTEEDVKRCNLILFGDPGSNRWIAKVLPRLPLRWTAEELKVGGTTYNARDHAPVLINPNPLAEGRYVVLNSGHTFHEKELASLNYLLFPRLGDWAVVATKRTPDEAVVRAGYCDEQWQVSAVADKEDEPGKKIAPFFLPPDEFADDFGNYKSPLEFADGSKVKKAEDWPKRRAEILKIWNDALGPWPELIEKPTIEYLEKETRDGVTQHHVRIEVAPKVKTEDAYLLIPEGKGPFPAVLVVFYDAKTGIGRSKTERCDFALQLAKRGFVTLSLGSSPESYYPSKEKAQLQPLSYHAYEAANCHRILASLTQVDAKRIGVVGHSYGGKWAMFAACLYDRFACAAWSDPGIVFDEKRSNVNYWERWYLGHEPGATRKEGIPSEKNPRTGAYKKLVDGGHDLHELHALMAPRPFLVSGGAEDQPERWKALNHTVAVNELLGYKNRVAMTNRKGHSPTDESNEQMYLFFEWALKAK